ncbi:MAG: nucleotidyltransferase [Anaerolineales bacterium]|nr:nucleotidyltransferase [Anaerolineales bacterium]
MFVNSDFSDLLRIFNEHGVKYLVVGGYAVVQYAEPRYTKDLDVLIATDKKNAEAVYSALREFGAPLAGLTSKDFAEDGFFFQMGVPPVRVDVIMGIPGVNFEECWNRRVEVDFEGLSVIFISKQDLIVSKRAAGRLQDLMDADLLSNS